MNQTKKAILIGGLLTLLLITPALAADEVMVITQPMTKEYVANGRTITSADGALRLGIFPKVLQMPTDVVIKRRPIETLPPLPAGATALSDYWEYDITAKGAYNGRRPLVAQLSYQPPTDGAYVQVMTFNGKTWRAVPSKVLDPTLGTVRAWFQASFMRFAVVATPAMNSGGASWYRYKNCDCAASPDYPKGTQLRVTNQSNGKSVVVTINDFGPDRAIHPDRAIDLDVVAFKKIASTGAGVVPVTVEYVAPPTSLAPPQ